MCEKKLSAGAAKRLVASKQFIDPVAVQWLQDWIENLVRGRSLPPQLCSPNFQGLLLQMYPAQQALTVLEELRSKFYGVFPHLGEPAKIEEAEFASLLPYPCQDGTQ